MPIPGGSANLPVSKHKGVTDMAETEKSPPATSEEKQPTVPATGWEWPPFERLRDEIDRAFDDFRRGSWLSPFSRKSLDLDPFWRRELSVSGVPAVDIAEKDSAYEITAELPGMEEKDIDVELSDGMLAIKGEKKEEKEEKKKDYYLSERRFGSFRRSFRVPESVDADKIEAQFQNGVLTLILPKSEKARKQERKIAVKTG
jgi:HSP20 family protein